MIIRRSQSSENNRAQPIFRRPNNRHLPALWITGQSVLLQERMLRTAALRSATILRPVAETDHLSSQTLELIAEVIVNRGVRFIVVCGETSDISWPASESPLPDKAAGVEHDSLVERMRKYLRCRRLAQMRIKRQLQQMQAHVGVMNALKSQSASLIGMFYLPENDAFLIFDQKDNQFVPLSEVLL